jgi:tetratricopeptide (TPR) repeat protein
MDVARSEIILRSGSVPREAMPLATFELTWARSDHWAIVVTRPGTWPATARAEDAEQSAVGFERAAEPELALRAYRSLLARWPHRLAGMMGEGNVLLKLARHREAALAFDAAATRHDSAAAWNNLAIARARAGEADAAAIAIEKAINTARAKEPSLLAAVSDTRERLLRGDVP